MVHADPGDLHARGVYADALLEAGDPRGELIALQLARTWRGRQQPSRRELELLAQHRAAWLGPLASVLHLERSTFANGFLSCAVLRGDRPHMMLAALDHPEWRTVEALDV